MAAVTTFLENLFNSIFTPGPTPALLVATNATFAALQLLFFTLLLATYSIHFIILSTLCAGLWWAINWFAAEIKEAQAKEEEAKRIREAKKGRRGGGQEEGDDGDAEGEGDDTEVEPEIDMRKEKGRESERKPTLIPGPKPKMPKPGMQSTVFVERPSEEEYPGLGRGGRESTPIQSNSGPVGASTTGASTKLAPLVDDTLKKRKSLGESTGELSTDSEWEKLSQDSGDK